LRVRGGDYRIIYTVADDVLLVVVMTLGPSATSVTGDERTVADAADPRHLQRCARATDLIVLLGVVSVVAAALLGCSARIRWPVDRLLMLAGVVAVRLIALRVRLLLGTEVRLTAAVQ